jgi:hypothetical protein
MDTRMGIFRVRATDRRVSTRTAGRKGGREEGREGGREGEREGRKVVVGWVVEGEGGRRRDA